jgi:DNA-binding LytR/AlgR family response regulator
MNLNIGICDDDPEIHLQLEKYFTLYTVATDNDFKITHYYSGEELFMDYSLDKGFNLLILDIEMNGISGIEVAEKIRKIPDHNVIIIFLSSYPEYMQSCFRVHAHRFFIKPLTYDYFKSQLTDIIHEICKSGLQLLLAVSSTDDVLINLSDIIYIKTDKLYSFSYPLAFYCRNGVYHCKGSLTKYEESLKKAFFVCPKRGYLLNIRYIYKFKTAHIELTTGDKIPLSPQKEKLIKSMFQNFILDMRYSLS